MQITKKAKLEQFDKIHRERGLLQRYFWDSRRKLENDAKATYRTKDGDRFTAYAYGTNRGDGGYIVIDNKMNNGQGGLPSIQYYDDWTRVVAELPYVTSEFCLAMRSLAEQIRHALYQKQTILTADWESREWGE